MIKFSQTGPEKLGVHEQPNSPYWLTSQTPPFRQGHSNVSAVVVVSNGVVPAVVVVVGSLVVEVVVVVVDVVVEKFTNWQITPKNGAGQSQ